MSRYITKPCAVCKIRQSRGFGFKDSKKFCSKICQDIYYNLYQQGKTDMIDKTEFEQECLEKTLVPLSEYLMEKGALGQSLGTLPRDTVIGMVEVIVTAYMEYMTEVSKNARF